MRHPARVGAMFIAAILALPLAAAPVAACEPDCELETLWDIRVGSGSSKPAQMTAVGSGDLGTGAVYFSADDGTSGRELWLTGHGRVKNIRPGSASSEPREMTRVGGKVMFSANDGTTGRELWLTDGTAGGTRRVKDIVAGPTGSNPKNLTAVGRRLFFSVGSQLWKSDGTAAGTRMVKELDFGGLFAPSLGELTAFGGRLFFVRHFGDADVDFSELWVSDGTAAGTHPFPSADGGVDAPSQLTRAGSRLYFRSGWDELWRTDGTVAGTKTLGSMSPDHLTNVAGTLYFVGAGGLWKSGGSVATTAMFRAFADPTDVGALTSVKIPGDPSETAMLAFTVRGEDVWRSDGTAAGTFRVVNAASGAVTRNLTSVGELLYFTINGRLKLIFPVYATPDSGMIGFPGLTNVKNLTAFGVWSTAYGGQLMISADDGTHGQEVWIINSGD